MVDDTVPVLIRFVVSETVCNAMQLDSAEHRQGYGVTLSAKQPKRGWAITGTLEQMERFARFLVDMRITCDDQPASMRRACVQAGLRLYRVLGLA